MARMIKVYPCPKCGGTDLIIKGGMRVECLQCWSTNLIRVWNENYRQGLLETKKLKREGKL